MLIEIFVLILYLFYLGLCVYIYISKIEATGLKCKQMFEVSSLFYHN